MSKNKKVLLVISGVFIIIGAVLINELIKAINQRNWEYFVLYCVFTLGFVIFVIYRYRRMKKDYTRFGKARYCFFKNRVSSGISISITIVIFVTAALATIITEKRAVYLYLLYCAVVFIIPEMISLFESGINDDGIFAGGGFIPWDRVKDSNLKERKNRMLLELKTLDEAFNDDKVLRLAVNPAEKDEILAYVRERKRTADKSIPENT